ncbi:MAG: RdgB/HAM1 family non-canonical purine NTP pyrophosphatase [Methylococcales bacterium]|nr:RdgB/HAM1 family non-canonical purine NTP pyrophosphatase [Methylococcales bacterium]
MILPKDQKIVLASNNQGKINEFQTMLADYSMVPQSNFNIKAVDETGTTFVENAILKARHAAFKSQLPAIADDSGLVVDALGGQPGIISARYAGLNASDHDNRLKLINEIKQQPDKPTNARFVCVLVFMLHADDPCPLIAQGIWEGNIISQAAGDNGFGYDPIFFVNESNCTSAQLSSEQKNSLSHRGKALSLLRQQLESK